MGSDGETGTLTARRRTRLRVFLRDRVSPVVLAIALPTLIFVAARSVIGFARWRLQRELWRRDVDRLGDPSLPD